MHTAREESPGASSCTKVCRCHANPEAQFLYHTWQVDHIFVVTMTSPTKRELVRANITQRGSLTTHCHTRQVHSEKAAELKAAWTPLVNYKAAFDEVYLTNLQCEKYSYLDFAKAKANASFEDFEASYSTCCNKVVEIMVARSLARPLPPNTSRPSLVSKAVAMKDKLEGKLPAALGVLVSTVLSPKDVKDVLALA